MGKKYILYNPMWKDIRRIEKVLAEKPETWEKYENKEGGKEKILEMEMKEFKEAKEKADDSEIGKKEYYKAAKHVAAAALCLMYDIRSGEDDKL